MPGSEGLARRRRQLARPSRRRWPPIATACALRYRGWQARRGWWLLAVGGIPRRYFGQRVWIRVGRGGAFSRRRRAGYRRAARVVAAAAAQPVRRRPHSRDAALGGRLPRGQSGRRTAGAGGWRDLCGRGRGGPRDERAGVRADRLDGRCRRVCTRARRWITGSSGSRHRASAGGWLRRLHLLRTRLLNDRRRSVRSY